MTLFHRFAYSRGHGASTVIQPPNCWTACGFAAGSSAPGGSEIAVACVPGAWRPTSCVVTVVRDLNQKNTHQAGTSRSSQQLERLNGLG